MVEFRDTLQQLREKIAGTRAILVVGPDGVLVDCLVEDPETDVETLAAEYPTLLRIAERTSEDAGGGRLVELILVSDNAVTVARSISSGHFLVLVTTVHDQIGRARYELRQAAWEIENFQLGRVR